MLNTYLGYQNLQQAQTPQLLTKKTNQQRFWRKYQPHELITQHPGFMVYSISANHNDKDLMLFAHGRSVSLVDTKRKQVTRQFANFDTNITSVMMRKDGAVMVLGDEVGRIEVMDTKEKFRLRSFKNHKKRINCLDFEQGGNEHFLYSVSDDMTLRQYDVAAGNVTASYDNIHSDYVKCVRSVGNNTVITGGYDCLVKMFDIRSPTNPVLTFENDTQLEWMDLFPSNLSFVACGQKKISLWDIRKNKSLLSQTAGKKTISCVRVALDGSRILTSSLDNHFKVFKADSFQLTYQQKLESAITTFDINKSNLCLGLGLQNKKFFLKVKQSGSNMNNDEQQNAEEQEVEDEIAQWFNKNLQESKNKSALNNKYFYRGIYEKPDSYEIMFERNQNKRVGDFDKMLKKFQYKKAFIISLRKKNTAIFLALVDEYTQRGCLERTIKSLTEKEVEEVLQILTNMLTDVRYDHIVVMLLDKIVAEHSDKLQSLAGQQLKKSVEKELQCIHEMKQVCGMLQLIQNNCL